jgi:eukaryotic translation initiation factor 2C
MLLYRPREFKVIVKHAAVVNMERLTRYLECKGEKEIPSEAIQVMNVLMQAVPTMIFLSVKRGTGGAFFSEYDPKFISGGLVALNGWKQSVRPTYKDLLLNLDRATTSYYPSGSSMPLVITSLQSN